MSVEQDEWARASAGAAKRRSKGLLRVLLIGAAVVGLSVTIYLAAQATRISEGEYCSTSDGKDCRFGLDCIDSTCMSDCESGGSCASGKKCEEVAIGSRVHDPFRDPLHPREQPGQITRPPVMRKLCTPVRTP